MTELGVGCGIETVIEDDEWNRALPNAADLVSSCYGAALKLEPTLLDSTAALLLTNDASVRSLNAQYRNKDAPTNVLAFPAEPDGVQPGPLFLGDIAVARETSQREAMEKGISIADHTAHLVVHGVLHLIGYDHQNEQDAVRMETREREILNLMGVSDPYASDLGADEMEIL